MAFSNVVGNAVVKISTVVNAPAQFPRFFAEFKRGAANYSTIKPPKITAGQKLSWPLELLMVAPTGGSEAVATTGGGGAENDDAAVILSLAAGGTAAVGAMAGRGKKDDDGTAASAVPAIAKRPRGRPRKNPAGESKKPRQQ